MKLDEFHIGDARARAIRHGNPVAGGDGWVGRVQICLPRAAGAQQHRAGIKNPVHRLVLVERHCARAPRATRRTVEYEINCRVAPNTRMFLFFSARNTSARSISLPVASATCMMRLNECPPSLPNSNLPFLRELHAQFDKFAHAVGTFAHNQFNDVAVAQARACDERVAHVGIERIVLAERRGNAALRVICVLLRRRAFSSVIIVTLDRSAARSAKNKPAMPLPITSTSCAFRLSVSPTQCLLDIR